MEPLELFLCEISNLFLHPNQPYIFRKHPSCPDCERYANGLGARKWRAAVVALNGVTLHSDANNYFGACYALEEQFNIWLVTSKHLEYSDDNGITWSKQCPKAS